MGKVAAIAAHSGAKSDPTPGLVNQSIDAGFAALVSPRIDGLMIGGLSLLLLALMSVMLKSESPDRTLGWTVFGLSFFVNFPHFLVSYQMLYVDFGNRIFKQARYFWAAIVVPAILLGVLIAGFSNGSSQILGWLPTAMYFFVGWHYVKQIFGGITVTNALRKFYYNPVERRILKANLFSLWAISFLAPNIGQATFVQDGINYSSLNLPAWLLPLAFSAMAVSGVALILVNLQKYIREGHWPAPAAIICFASIYAWYLPLFKHPMYMHTIPFFHSLQYLLFVYVFRRNKVNSRLGNDNTPELRRRRLLELYGYLTIPFVTGATLMYLLPRAIDSMHLVDERVFGPTSAYFAFVVFINVHHYFIDNVLWRGDNPEMRQYLFASSR